jgi:hypothetical protein
MASLSVGKIISNLIEARKIDAGDGCGDVLVGHASLQEGFLHPGSGIARLG